MEKENKRLEYKETAAKTYLKTVSAYSNYNDGEIIFGVADGTHEIVGIDDPAAFCLAIENQINDCIKPHPDFVLKVNADKTVSLFVKKGDHTPYRYGGKSYKRNDSSTVEVDETEEKRLIMSGMNISFEELPTKDTDLSFEYLGKELKRKLSLEKFDIDTLKSLNLYSVKNGYSNAAALLSDHNSFPGLDIAVFGENINVFRRRVTLAGESILKQYRDALDIYEQEYVIERIEGGYRKRHELIPSDAFREAVANAIVHRVWDVKANAKVEMHPDKIIVSSPGGLVADMTKEDYTNGNYSYLRNPIIANVFRRLDIIEAFATGIKRINEAYRNALSKPIYEVTDSAISVTLPLVDHDELTANERAVLQAMKTNRSYNRLEMESACGLAKDTLIRTLNALIEKGLVVKGGKAKTTFYVKK